MSRVTGFQIIDGISVADGTTVLSGGRDGLIVLRCVSICLLSCKAEPEAENTGFMVQHHNLGGI